MFMKEFGGEGRKYRLLGVSLKDFKEKSDNRMITSFFEASESKDKEKEKDKPVFWTKTSPEQAPNERAPLKESRPNFWNFPRKEENLPSKAGRKSKSPKKSPTKPARTTNFLLSNKPGPSRLIDLEDFSDDSRGSSLSTGGRPNFWNLPRENQADEPGPSTTNPRAIEIDYISDDSRSSTISNLSSCSSTILIKKRTTMTREVPKLIEEYQNMGEEALQTRLEDIICPEELEELRKFQNEAPKPTIYVKPKTDQPNKSKPKPTSRKATKKSPSKQKSLPKTSVKDSAISKMFQKAQKRKSDEANLTQNKKPHNSSTIEILS